MFAFSLSNDKFQLFIKLFTIILIQILNSSESTGLPPKIEQHPNSVIVNVTDPVTLECRANGSPKPDITWYKDGTLLPIAKHENGAASSPLNFKSNRYALIHDSNLFIFSTMLGRGNKSDNGVYNCKASNQYGFVLSENATILITYLKDDFREMPRSRQVNAGSSINLNCKAPRGFPEPIVWWEKDGVKLNKEIVPKYESPFYDLTALSNSVSYHTFDNGSLIIKSASAIDNGEYVCVAKNEAGSKRTAAARLNVFEKPNFIIQPETSKYQAGNKVELECEASGFPKPQIEWKKDNSMENLPSKALIRDSLLIIPNVQVEDEGEYTCVATNQLASIEAKAYMIVYEKPSFIKTMSNLTIGIDSKSLTIECNARGKPQPVIYWAKSGHNPQKPINSNDPQSDDDMGSIATQDDFLILENGNLFIERLSKKYEGTYLCQASNEYGSIETKTYLQTKSIQSKPPPIIVYGPQNQTIPINTQATLECITSTASTSILTKNVNNNENSLNDNSEKIEIAWFKGVDQIKIQTQFEMNKYTILNSGSLQINAVQNTDTGVYKCQATNSYGQTASMPAYLNIENPNNQYVEFRRNYQATALPSAPTQPLILTTTTNSVSLSWQPSSHSGHSPIRSYVIEYFSPEWPKYLPGWTLLIDNILPINSYTVENLQSDTYYMFIVRARNDQGFGPPSQVSDLVKTMFEPQVLFRNKNSNDLLEKALTGEIIQLNEPPEIISSTSINITWKIFKSEFLIEGFYIKYKPIGSKSYLTHTLLGNREKHFVLKNLQKFTTYEILIEPFSGLIKGSESNIAQAKTKEDTPTQSPINLNVEIDTLNSISIKWQPPPFSHMNGIILGYKIVCLTNETKLNLNLNTNATTRAIILGNLIQELKYCIKVAAYTRIGTGPFTTSKCIEMTSASLNAKQNVIIKASDSVNSQSQFSTKLKNLISQPWFIVCVALVLSVLIFSMFYCAFYKLKKYSFRKKHKKYLSSSENCSLNVPHKIDNGNRYKLVNDTIWLDTLHSNSNNSNNQECCCGPDLHHQLFLNQNSSALNGNMNLNNDLNSPALSSLEKQRLQNMSIKSKFTASTNSGDHPNNLSLCSSSVAQQLQQQPQYAEIYGPSSLHQQQQHHHHTMANPYATTGLFVNQLSENNLSNNSNMKYSSYTIKMLNDNKAAIAITNQQQQDTNDQLPLTEQKKLLKYLQATQSQTNTPRVHLKNLQNTNRVKSVEQQQHQSNNSFSNFHNHSILPLQLQETFNTLPIQTQHQIINQILATTTDPTKTSQKNNNPNLPTLPLAPPPSLASALYAQQQYQQQQQLIEDFIQNTLARGQQQQQPSPVQYNSPWNVNLDGDTVNNHPTSNLNNRRLQTLSPNINKNSQMSFNANHNLLSSTFTAQQYANRTLNNKLHISHQHQLQQQQQDYSSISPVSEINDEYISYPQQQQFQQNQFSQHLLANKTKLNENSLKNVILKNENWACSSSINDTQSSSNPVSSNSLTNSSNSSNLSSKRSSRSGDELAPAFQQQHYSNHHRHMSDVKLKDVDILITNTDFISELPQTIL